MNKPSVTSVTSVAHQSLRFEPCIGVNVAISDEKYGLWLGSAGYSDLDARVKMGASSFYIYSHCIVVYIVKFTE